jgi:tRNA threonylcarbamoyladenosine modification (KEOPS) complex  Pcc1 subunit
MDYHAQIKVKGDASRIMRIMEAEEKTFSRSQFSVKRAEEGVVFDIESKDPTALRATLNTITQFLVIYHGLADMAAHKHKKTDKKI